MPSCSESDGESNGTGFVKNSLLIVEIRGLDKNRGFRTLRHNKKGSTLNEIELKSRYILLG